MSEIGQFYAGCSVLVTGGTGFLGAILVEKLVRSCPDLDTVYLLIRERNGYQAQHRLNQLLAQPVFQKLSDKDKGKIVAVQGDLYSEDLSLDKEDLQTLLTRVSVVLHLAANINFSSRLIRSIETNVLGTRRVLQLAKKMSHIKSFVYVSTAYCNCVQRDVIAEKVYPNRWSPDELVKAITSDEKFCQKRILGGHPNGYSFSKLLAENVVAEERGDLPVAIVRPSIVLGTLKEPMPGWVDNVNNGQFAFIAGASVGVFRTLLAHPDVVADLVPSDQLACLVIASAYRAYENKQLDVYHFTSGSKNAVTWRQYCELTMEGIHKYPLAKQVMYPRASCRPSLLRNRLQVYISHYVPAFLIDLVAPLTQEKPLQLSIQKKYNKGMEHSRYFTTKQFEFSTVNTERLLESLTEEDRAQFDFDVGKIDWRSYMESCVLGVRLYYHKEDLKKLHEAKQSFYGDMAVYGVFWFALTWALWSLMPLGHFSLPTSILFVLLYYTL